MNDLQRTQEMNSVRIDFGRDRYTAVSFLWLTRENDVFLDRQDLRADLTLDDLRFAGTKRGK